MPSFNQIKDTAVTCLNHDPRSVFYITGVPGGGKSDCGVAIANALGYDYNPSDPNCRVVKLHAANHDTVDLSGLPSIRDGATVFNPTAMLARFRKGSGGGVCIIEELGQAEDDMQCFLAGVLLERATTEYEFDDNVSFIITGNRTEDKAGVRDLLSHLSDRMFELEMETSLDDWCDYAVSKGVDFRGIAFLRLRPDLLNDFDPDKRKSPTQRGWTQLFTQIPMDTLPVDMYLHVAEGRVGEEAAGQWVAAKDMMEKMPDIDDVRANPRRAMVPSEPSVMYAISTALAYTSNEDVFDGDVQYMERFPQEFLTAFMSDVISAQPELQMTETFIDYADRHQDLYKNAN